MRRFLLFTLISVWVIAAAESANACLCKSESPAKAIKRLYKEASAIFVGVPKEVIKEGKGYTVTLVVEQSWKGNTENEITIYTEGGCKVWFEVGKKYLVYAITDDIQRLQTNVCMRTGLIKYSDKDLKVLGKPKVEKQTAITNSQDLARRRTLVIGQAAAQSICVISERKVKRIQGLVMLPNKIPVDDAHIVLHKGSEKGEVVDQLQTDKKGRFAFTVIESGKYVIVVSFPTLVTLYVPVRLAYSEKVQRGLKELAITLDGRIDEPCGGGSVDLQEALEETELAAFF